MYSSKVRIMSHYMLVSQLPPDQLKDDAQLSTRSSLSFSDKTSTQL